MSNQISTQKVRAILKKNGKSTSGNTRWGSGYGVSGRWQEFKFTEVSYTTGRHISLEESWTEIVVTALTEAASLFQKEGVDVFMCTKRDEGYGMTLYIPKAGMDMSDVGTADSLYQKFDSTLFLQSFEARIQEEKARSAEAQAEAARKREEQENAFNFRLAEAKRMNPVLVGDLPMHLVADKLYTLMDERISGIMVVTSRKGEKIILTFNVKPTKGLFGNGLRWAGEILAVYLYHNDYNSTRYNIEGKPGESFQMTLLRWITDFEY